MTDLLSRTAALVDVASVSFEETRLADQVEAELAAHAHLEVVRVGDNVVARTQLGRGQRLLLGGHLDTVPPADNERARVDGDRLYGLGSTDMKGGLAVMLDLAGSVAAPTVDVTYVFYAKEEVAAVHSGLIELFDAVPDWLEADLALLGEPTDGAIEAGCQGTMRLEVALRGAPAHTARPWMGRNAVHRLAPVLSRLAAYEARCPVIDGCEFREALQAVQANGGTGANVVPAEAKLLVNHRWAPDRSADEAEAWVREWLAPVLEEGDTVTRVEAANAAAPALSHPLMRSLIETNELQVRSKLGWTDVARFAERGVPAANFGPGDPTLAHTAGEYLERDSLERVATALRTLIT